MRERKERTSSTAHPRTSAVTAQRARVTASAEHLASAKPFASSKPMTADAMRTLQRTAGNAVASRQLAVQRAPGVGDAWDDSKVFKDPKDAIKYGRKVWGGALDQMSGREEEALRDYTNEPKKDFQLGYPTYRETNKYLRGQFVENAGKHGIDDVKAHVRRLGRALETQPIPHNVIATRGCNFLPDGMAKSPWRMEGRKYTELGFLSTSLGPRPVAPYDQEPFIFRYRIPEGTPAMWMEFISHFGAGEMELLLKNDSRYRVDKVTPYQNKYGEEQWYIDATILVRPENVAAAKAKTAAKEAAKKGGGGGGKYASHGGSQYPAGSSHGKGSLYASDQAQKHSSKQSSKYAKYDAY
ncbi:ADP-ribosyltransferase [Streptomyces sp. NBC_01089]|uniref:ADP-ribosyltransferase n=1 Tax=Streptomyces sp. NBC_01089 TaxID=2903747 RepID=UPI00386452E8|nr:ADP-ribosyltransferase [Streptomyces sp. NBC_01089]